MAVIALIFILSGILILIIGTPGSRKLREATEKRASKHSEELKNIQQLIRELAEFTPKSPNSSPSDLISDLYVYANISTKIASEKYADENHITGLEASFSNLGVCGVSPDAFWYGINADKYDRLKEGNMKDAYIELSALVAKEVNTVHLNSDWSPSIDPLMQKITRTLSAYNYIFKSPDVSYAKILLEDIQYFKIEGNVQYISDVSGGGVNMQGAVAGAIIAGDTGAVIGSRVGTNTKTNIIEKDHRHIVLVYKEKGILKSMDIKSFQPDKTIDVLRNLIPQKEDTVVALNKQESTGNITSAQLSSADELRKYKELLDDGIITQEEFDAKKKQLLNL